MTEQEFLTKYSGDGSSGRGTTSSSQTGSTDTTRGRGKNGALRQEYLKKQENLNGYKDAISAAEERGDTLSALYGQYQLDVSNVLNSYNDRKTRGGYKSDAQDFYDRTMAMTTAARDSIFKLTDWMKENRASIGDDIYSSLMDEIRENSTSLSEIQKAAYDDIDFYGQFKDADDYNMWQAAVDSAKKEPTRGRGNESGLRNKWIDEHGVRVAPWQPSKSELETWTEDYVKANQELKDAQKALKKITPTEGMTLDDAQREYGTARIAAQQRVDDAQDKLDELGAKIEKYGGAVPKTELSANDWFNAVRYGFRSGITSADQAIAKGLDFFLGDALGELQTLGGETVRLFNPDFDYNEKNLLDRYVDRSQSHLDVQRERAAEAVGINRTAQKVNQYTEMVFNSLPMSVMAIMSGGATAAPQASTEALQIASAIANSGKAQQLLTPVLNAVKNMANDPNWQFTFMSTVGESYEDALADGASNEDAVINALLNAAANATIEVGGGDEALGGLQKLPKPLREALQRGDKSGVLQILKSIPSEAGEEIMQGIAEAGIKGIYKDVPLFSMNDEGAVISPSRMLDEAKGAAVVSAVLGGGQYAAEAGLNAAERSRANKEADAVAKQLYGDSADTLVQQGLESPVDSKSYKLARQYQTILDNNGELSGKQIRKLVHANSEQIRTEGETEAQAQTGAGKEAAQQTAPQTQSTPPAQTNTETGAQTTAQQTRSTGAMEAIYKGQVGNVVSLTKTDKGWAATIEQPNGKRSNVMEWQAVFDPDTQGILDAFRPSAYADEMLKTYALTDEQVEPKTYALAFNTVADIYGKSTSLTKQQAQEASRRDGGAAAILTDEQFSRAFDAGRNSKDSSIQNSVTRKSSKGAVGFKGVQYQGMTYRAATKDMVSDAELSVLKTMSKAVGVDMVLYQSEEQNGEYQGANGFYRNGTVYLDVHAGATKTTEQSAILLTAAHELTHYLRENNAEAYTELQDFVMQHLIESGTDIETLAKKKVDKERGLISMEDAAEEVIADSCEMMLENTQVPQMMAKENPGLFAQIREWLAEFAAKLRRAFEGVQARSAEAQAMMQYAEELQQMWDNALAGAAQNTRNNTQNARNNAQAEADNGTTAANNGTDAANNGTTSGRGKASIRELDGERVAWVDEDITRSKPKDVSMEKYVKQYIENMISQNGTYLGTLPDSGMRVFAETQGRTPKSRYGLADEYVRSSYTRWIKDNSKNKFRAKMKAAGVLDDLVSIATDRTWEKTKHTQNKDAQYGVYNYNSTFAFPVYDSKGELSNVRAYDCQMVILNASDGKKYLYDVIRIKENTTKANDFLLAERQRVANEATRQGDVSGNSISRNTENDNTKFSQRERDEDLQKKYPKLNLNEDISELDGVPAVELTDGSVLPILDRDRYPTHVSFIEGNRIDVDDLRSGGWIGDGVYDPSFTSDTARYIERKQAGKRVAELRGVPFNQFEDDGKSSMRDNTTDDTAAERKGRQESYANLRAENAKLREQLDYWKGQTKLTKEKTVRKTDADAYAKRLTEQLHNPKAREQVADEIKRMGDYIVQTPGSELSYTEVKDWALAIADYVLQDSQTVIDDSQAESLQQLYGYLKDNKLRVTDDTFNDLPEGWVRQHRGRIKLSEDGLDVDTAWGELQEKFGEGMFPSDITAQADMLMHIADTIEAMKPTYGNPFAGYMGEMREAVAQDILDTVLSDEIRQTAMTAADRAQARLDKRIAQDTARYNALRDAKDARIEQIERESRERYNALREKKNQRIEQIKKEGTERTKKAVQRERTFQLQRVERAQKVKSIEKLTKSLSKKMIENNAKYHIPDVLKEPIGKFLMNIDTTTSRSGEKARNEFADRLKRVSEVLEAQRKYNQGEGTEGSNVYYDLPPDFTEQMQELANKVKFWTDYNNGQEWKLEDMDLRDLFELENIVKVVSHAVTQANELLSMNTSVDEVGQEAVQYLDKLGEMKTTPGGAEEFLDYKNLTPVYFFKRFGTAGEKIFNTLKDGWSKLAFNSKEIIDFAKTLYSTEEVRDAEKNVIELQLHRRVNENENSEALRTEETEPVYMTKAQIMNLYGLSLREQALTHLLGAGIHIKDIKRAGKKALHQGDNYLLTMEELTDIFNEHLTNRDREIVQGMQKFMSTVCAKWYMEVNQKRWGIDGNIEENYWPIETDSRNRQAKGTEGAGSTISLFRLANMGFTKPIKPNSTNAINIGSAFDVFANHAADMAKYNSMVIPVLDAMKWLSYSNIVATSATSGQYTTMSVQKAMDKTYGPAAQAYFTQLIRDINGSHEGGSVRTGLEGMTARYKRQAVGSNLRVALLQPTAYARAGMVLDLKYLAMGGVKQNQIIKSYKEAIKHSGTATWKSLGFYDVNINASLRSLIKQDETAVDKVVGWSMKLAELGDQWTWAMLWNACKTEQQDKAKRAGKKLDYETLMQKTSERFDEVVYQTQVMDSTLTRSEIMRSDDRLVKAATSFMAEPTLSYNTVLNMYDEYRREARAVGKSAAWKKLGNKIMRGIGIYVTQATLGAVVESIMDAWRDDDDYMTFMEKWAEKFWGDYFFDGNLYGDLTVVGKLPVVKDFISALQGEESSRMDTEGLASLYKFGLTSYNKIKAMIEDGEDTTKVTAWGWIEQGLRAASQLLGLPGYNLSREVVAVWNNTIGQWTDSKIKRYKPQPEKEIKNAYLKGYLTEDEAKELLMDRETMGDKTYMIERQALMAIDDWTDNGEKYKALYTALENKDRKAYDEAFDALKESGRYAYDIQTKVRAQIKEWYVGDKRGNGKYKINKEDAVAMLKEYGNMTDYDAESAVHTWTCKVVEGFDYNEKKDLFYAGDLSFADAVKVVERYGKNDKGKFLSDIDDGYDEARKEVLKWTMRTEVGIDYDDMRSAYNDGDITIEQVAEWSKKYGSLDDEAIETRCYRWEWTKDTPEASGIFEGQARRYDAYMESTGMTKEQYFNLVDGHGAGTFSADLKPGSTTSYVKNSKRDKAWAYIDSLKITPEEKDALAMCYAAENGDGIDKPSKSWMKLEDAPWNN
ncbi:MAG: hypothetical protein SOX75_03265 [Candidatus Limivicinus sp.]|nr:hypothetical protein [Candidatus Limivicinus sp.]